MDDIESSRVVEHEQGESGDYGGRASIGRPGRSPEQTSFAEGRHRHKVVDNSHNDNSYHHHGHTHNETTNNFNWNGGQSEAMKLLLSCVSKGALHNSAQRCDAPKCYPETRKAVQEEIHSWIKRGRQSVLWLSGPAGSGKTAIVGSVADDCHKGKLLAAAFFFSSFAGSSDRCSKRFFIATLVYQLMQHDAISGFRDEVLAALDRDPLILDLHLDGQVEALLLDPLRKAFQLSGARNWPLLILVDGLDECGGDAVGDGVPQGTRKSQEDNHKEILSVLVRASNDPSFPFRIIVASRPERAIEGYISSMPQGSVKEVFLNDKYKPAADIELFIKAKLLTIGRKYDLQDDWYTHALPPDWSKYKTRDVPLYLAEEASEQFVYAATVIRYVQDQTAGNTPTERLRDILSSQQQSRSKPFSALDALYSMILNTSPRPLLSAKWIAAVNHLSAGYGQGLFFVKAILESTPGQTEAVLGNLTSIIGLPTSGNDSEEVSFRLYHKSLLDFLGDPGRSVELYVSNSARDEFLQNRFYQTLKNRGPEVPRPSDSHLDKFLETFYQRLPYHHNSEYRYNADDVEWWCSHIDRIYNHLIASYFQWVHEKCHWYHCKSSCEVWRKGIMRYCKAKGWRVPSWTELLRDRFMKKVYDVTPFRFSPLHPPVETDSSIHMGGTPRYSIQDFDDEQEHERLNAHA